MLYKNMDFVTYPTVTKEGEHYSSIAVISEEKVWKLLGEREPLLEKWLIAISKRENLPTFLKEFVQNVKSKDYAKRRMPLYAKETADILKECIHNGMGLPYIPGSSIKGAIRTAVLASLANTVEGIENKIVVKDKAGYPKKDKYGNTLVKAERVEQELFGKDPNNDVFRFIQVGDAYFEEGSEIATRMVNLNIRDSHDDLMDTGKQPLLVEAIEEEQESEFQLKVAKGYYDFVKKQCASVGALPVGSVEDLFQLINAHTGKLVKEEIAYWKNVGKTGADDYLEEMQNILKEVQNCKDGTSCVLRIGHASGWRFITGAWTKPLSNFKETVVPASRRNNGNYLKYDFPKTRRIDDMDIDTEGSCLFGFVKLTLK
jgi:CRISPR type III-A-associated RAMP protein Csm5